MRESWGAIYGVDGTTSQNVAFRDSEGAQPITLQVSRLHEHQGTIEGKRRPPTIGERGKSVLYAHINK